MKINWPLAAAATLFFVVGITGRCLYEQVAALRTAVSEERKISAGPAPKQKHTSLPATFEIAVPEAASVSSVAEPAVETKRAPEAFLGKAAEARREKPLANLSSYKVRPKQAGRTDYLPADESLTPEQLKENVNRRENEGGDWKGKGVIGEILRGAQKTVRKMDDATLGASRKALGDMASPDKATIRPDGGGVRLHINIPN